jgi:hypothetical protein
MLLIACSSSARACPALDKSTDDKVRYLLCDEGLYDRKYKAYFFKIQFDGLRITTDPRYAGDIYYSSRDPLYSNQELSMFVDLNRDPILIFRRKELQENTFPTVALAYVVAENMVDENGLTIGKKPDEKWISENCSFSEGLHVCTVSFIKTRTNQKAFYVLDSAQRVKNITISYSYN